jgi:hypothetical protein
MNVVSLGVFISASYPPGRKQCIQAHQRQPTQGRGTLTAAPPPPDAAPPRLLPPSRRRNHAARRAGRAVAIIPQRRGPCVC